MQKNKTKVVVISQFSLPYGEIASWPTMYNYLLQKVPNEIDYIICPKVDTQAENVSYRALREIVVFDKIKGKLINPNKKYSNYTQALNKLIKKGEKYVLHIIDNSGVVIPINTYLEENYKRSDFYIQYCYHGFLPIVSREVGNTFLEGIDEIIFLTRLAYLEFKNFYMESSFKARVIHNGVSSKLFNRVSLEAKHNLRQNLFFEPDETILMWCSQDRPKKGLRIVLEAFSKVYKERNNIKLIIIGIDKNINQEGVIVVGRIANNELPKYYQLADIYLFPSLCQEGFGIVLAEALKCGCYCIGSKQGGIPEVLKHGKYGVIVENPNFIDEWVKEMKKAIDIIKTTGANPFAEVVPENIYDITDWCSSINLGLKEAKISMNLNNNNED